MINISIMQLIQGMEDKKNFRFMLIKTSLALKLRSEQLVISINILL